MNLKHGLQSRKNISANSGRATVACMLLCLDKRFLFYTLQ